MRKHFVYDSGALIAIDKRDAAVIRRHEARLGRGHHILVPAPVAAQVMRDPRRQARLRLTLRGCDLIPFGEREVTPVGTLLAGAGTADLLDGVVAVTAAKTRAAVVTTDASDIEHLLKTLGVRLPVLAP